MLGHKGGTEGEEGGASVGGVCVSVCEPTWQLLAGVKVLCETEEQ